MNSMRKTFQNFCSIHQRGMSVSLHMYDNIEVMREDVFVGGE